MFHGFSGTDTPLSRNHPDPGTTMSPKTFSSKFMAAYCLAALSGCGLDASAPEATEQPEAMAQTQSELEYNPGSGWSLAWSDEFEGSSLNTANWTTLNSDFDPVTNNCNFGTGELEYPRTQNVSVSGGKL